jgi:DNA-binding MarR family transcriptional regulator
MVDSQLKLTNDSDVAILLAAAYRAVAERLLAAMDAGGIRGMRPLYGFVIRAVAAESPTVSRLAELLDVTKQAASKLADDMCRAGFLQRREDPADRRRAHLVLSPTGTAVSQRARRTSAAMERELRAECGDAPVDAFRAVLLAFVARHGGLDDVRALRAKPAPERVRGRERKKRA